MLILPVGPLKCLLSERLCLDTVAVVGLFEIGVGIGGEKSSNRGFALPKDRILPLGAAVAWSPLSPKLRADKDRIEYRI